MPKTCKAIRINDQMICGRCALQWDHDDTDRPRCATIPASGRDILNELKELFKDEEPKK